MTQHVPVLYLDSDDTVVLEMPLEPSRKRTITLELAPLIYTTAVAITFRNRQAIPVITVDEIDE